MPPVNRHVPEKVHRNPIISQLLDTVGDGSGTLSAIGNYSGGAEEFFIAPGAEEIFCITRMIVSLSDAGAFDADKYGNNITITNGVLLHVANDSSTLYSLIQPSHPVTTNAGWAHYCHDFTEHGFGTGNVHGTARWTFSKSGKMVVLDGALGEKLVVTLEDDYSGLVSHHFLVQGYKAWTGYS